MRSSVRPDPAVGHCSFCRWPRIDQEFEDHFKSES